MVWKDMDFDIPKLQHIALKKDLVKNTFRSRLRHTPRINSQLLVKVGYNS
jgi:hypothetical protein